MRRLRRLHTIQIFLLGLLLGMVIASGVAITSARSYREPSIFLFNSGDGLSALIVSQTHRVLIANGNDPAALATSFRAARPDLLRRIDLVVIMPGATERVAERAVEISRPRRIYALPNYRFHPGNEINGQPIRPMDGPSTIDLGSSLEIRFDPGVSDGWLIEVDLDGVPVGLFQRVPLHPDEQLAAMAIMDTPIDDTFATLDSPIVLHAGELPFDLVRNVSQTVLAIARNDVNRITVSGHSLIVQP